MKMEFLRKILFRSKIEKNKQEIFGLLREMRDFFEKKGRDPAHRADGREKALLEELKSNLNQLSSLAPSELFSFVLQENPGEETWKFLSSLVAQIFEKQGARGEKLISKAFFNPALQNNPALAPFVKTLLGFGIHRLRPLLPKIFLYHTQNIPLRCAVLENLGRVIKKDELGPLFELLRQTLPEEAIEVYFSLRIDILPQHLKAASKEVMALLDSPSTTDLGHYLLGYSGQLGLVGKKLLEEEVPPEHRVSLLNSLALHLSGEKLQKLFTHAFQKYPDAIKPFYEQARNLSLFTPRQDELILLSMLQGEETPILKKGVESVLTYRPEFKKYLMEGLQNLSSLPLPAGLAVLQIFKEIGDRNIVPLLVQIYPDFVDYQQTIVQIVGHFQEGDRLIEILTHFKRRTKQRLVSDSIDRLIEQTRKERLKN